MHVLERERGYRAAIAPVMRPSFVRLYSQLRAGLSSLHEIRRPSALVRVCRVVSGVVGAGRQTLREVFNLQSLKHPNVVQVASLHPPSPSPHAPTPTPCRVRAPQPRSGTRADGAPERSRDMGCTLREHKGGSV
jgi:hypothetical protein